MYILRRRGSSLLTSHFVVHSYVLKEWDNDIRLESYQSKGPKDLMEDIVWEDPGQKNQGLFRLLECVASELLYELLSDF